MSNGSAPIRWWRPLTRADRWALSCMLVVPALLFIVPAVMGHAAIDADNLIQNFPLRVLSGRQIASGHLPLLNPYANSGTPLLGGMNAGSLYPGTLFFAFLPPLVAWTINLIAVYATAAIGMFALLRWHGLRTLSSFAAAMGFTYLGALIGQIVHLGVVQGSSFVPWAALIMVSLSRRLWSVEPSSWWRMARVALPSTMWFALLWGLTFLTGEPRAIATIELLCVIIVPTLLLMRSSYQVRTWRARGVYVLSLGVGLGWGVAIGLVQMLPGWSFIATSQRSSISYWFYGAGSLAVRWTPLLFVQDLFGGNGLLGQPKYFVDYNLPEVTGYAGVLALVAVAAFLSRLTRRGWIGEHRDYVVYFVIGVVGLIATWGSFTPLGHVFHALPLFGSTRLQSRNVILVDFAASALLGWWLNRLQARDARGAGVLGGARWVTMSPAIVVAVISIAMTGWGATIVQRLGATPAEALLARSETLSLSLHLALAAAAVVLVWRAASRSVVPALLVVLALDVVLFLVLCATGLFGGNIATMPSRTHAQSLLGSEGRMALVDKSGAHTRLYRALGTPNMNVFTGIESIQGYGSLISTIYDNSTGTHPMFMVDPCHLNEGSFTQLRLSAIAIGSTELSSRIFRGVKDTSSCARPRKVSSSQRYFGELLDVHEVGLVGYHAHTVSSGVVTLQLLNGSGQPTGPVLSQRGASYMDFVLPRGVSAGGFSVHSTKGLVIAEATVRQVGTRPGYYLDTTFQQAMSASTWRLSATVGTIQVFRAIHLLPEAWIVEHVTGSRVTSIRDASWGDTWVGVTTSRPVILKRSEAYLPGWRATALNSATGASITLPVSRAGLIQMVTVPAGDWTIHFHYHAPYIELGLGASLAASLVLLVGTGTLVLVSRRDRRVKVRS